PHQGLPCVAGGPFHPDRKPESVEAARRLAMDGEMTGFRGRLSEILVGDPCVRHSEAAAVQDQVRRQAQEELLELVEKTPTRGRGQGSDLADRPERAGAHRPGAIVETAEERDLVIARDAEGAAR